MAKRTIKQREARKQQLLKRIGKGKRPGVGGLLGAAMVPLAGYSLYSMLGGSQAEADQRGTDEMLMSMPERYGSVGEPSQLMGLEQELDRAMTLMASPAGRPRVMPRLQASPQLKGLLDEETVARLSQMRVKQQMTIEEALARHGMY